MRAHPWFAVAVLAAVLVSPPHAAVADHGGVHVPQARVGDRGVYVPDGADLGPFSFEWLDREVTLDRWSRPLPAHVLRMVIPAVELDERAPHDQWSTLREAFPGVGREPLWRQHSRDLAWQDNTQWIVLPFALIGAPAARETVREDNWTLTSYEPEPLLRSCLARNGVQGRTVGGNTSWPLEAVCPGMAWRGLDAQPQPARKTTFLGRAALEFAYRFDASGTVTGDLPLPPSGTLRLVFADGIPAVAEAEATDGSGKRAWRFTLDGFDAGAGAAVPAGQDGGAAGFAVERAGTRYAPLRADGPEDGGTGFAYRLDEALANLRGDPALGQFHDWERAHPQAFVLLAVHTLSETTDGHWAAVWDVTLGDPVAGEAGRFEIFNALSILYYKEGVPRLAGRTVGPVFNYNGGGVVDEASATRPAGEPSLDFASAIRVSAEQVPAQARAAPVSRVAYQPAGPGQPPLISVQRQSGHDVGDEMSRTRVVLDASSGGVETLSAYGRETTYGDLQVSSPLSRLTAETRGAAMPSLSGVEVASVTLVALLAAVLAHAGYVTVAYSRLRQSDLLDHPGRRRIYDLVQARPGVHFHGVVAAVGMGRGAVMYHLRVLERGSLVTPVSLRKFRRYYLTGSVPHSGMRRRAELASSSQRRVYEAVRREPGITLADLARRLDVSPVMAHKAVERLKDAGLVEKRADGADGRLIRITARELPGFS